MSVFFNIISVVKGEDMKFMRQSQIKVTNVDYKVQSEKEIRKHAADFYAESSAIH